MAAVKENTQSFYLIKATIHVQQPGIQRESKVARSTLAAESLAFSECCDMAYLILELAKEANIVNVNTKISASTDNQSLYNIVNRINLVSDRRFQVEISSIREMQNVNETETIQTESKKQLDDATTKKVQHHLHSWKPANKEGQPLTIEKIVSSSLY